MFDLFEKANLRYEVNEITASVEQQIKNRTVAASAEIRNTLISEVFRGTRSGKRYRIPSTKKYYDASAPGEPPAVRIGIFRNSFYKRPKVNRKSDGLIFSAGVESGLKVGAYLLGELLQNGTKKMEARSYREIMVEKALPKVKEIFDRHYV